MARTVALASLIAQVRQRADREGSSFFSDGEIIEYINQSKAMLDDELINADETYNLTSHAFSTVAGSGLYDLPTDFYKLRGLDATVTGNTFSVRRFSFDSRNSYDQPVIAIAGDPLAYLLQGSSLRLLPNPQGIYAMKLWYYPASLRITDGTSSFDGVSGFEEFVVLDAAIKCRQKEQMPINDLAASRDEQLARIRTNASRRDSGAAPVINRVRSRYNYGMWRCR